MSKATVMSVQGYEVDASFAKKLTDDAIWILGHVRRRGAAFVEFDDSKEHQDTRQQLRKMAVEGYFQIAECKEGYFDEHSMCIVGDRFRVEL